MFQVLEAIWKHNRPGPTTETNIELAFKVAETKVTLTRQKPGGRWHSAEIDLALRQDIQDLTALEVIKTPTFL